jgi:hypothetical protein
MPRPCLICSSELKTAKAAELMAAGLSDQAVANVLNEIDRSSPAMSYMAVSRHRRLHIVKTAQERLAIVTKGNAARRDRTQVAAAAAADAPTPAQFVEAFFGLKAQAEKLQRIEDRLERMAALAEESQSPNGVAQVAAQQLRSVEVGAKVAGIGGYGTQRAPEQGGGAEKFQIKIVFQGAGRTETISTLEAAETGSPDVYER